MKRCFLLMLTGFLMLFYGCAANDAVGSKLAGMDESEKLDWIIDQMDAAESIEWDQISQNSLLYEGAEHVEISHSSNKYIKEPLMRWCRLEMNNRDMQSFVIEIFDEEKNGTLTHSTRSSDIEKDAKALTSWNTSSVTGEEKDAYKGSLAQTFSSMAYLLRYNVDSFTSGSDQLEGITYTRYDGEIKQETILDYYEKYGRDVWVRMGLLAKKEGMSREDLKNEILNAANTPPYELAEGFNEILFSDDPAPVSIWIDDTDGSIKCIKIDYTAAWIGHIKFMDLDDQLTTSEKFTEYQDIVFDSLEPFTRL